MKLTYPEANGPFSERSLRMIRCAFGQQIHDEEFIPLLFLLGAELSNHGLANLMSELTGRDATELLFDVYSAVYGRLTDDDQKVCEVRDKLVACGYDDWVKERNA